jgi:hypothetical protein
MTPKIFSLKRLLMLSFLFISFAFEALPASFYVAPAGSNSNIGDSCARPWATFSYAMNRLSAGDTLWLCNGTYNQSLNVTISGTNGAPITFKAVNDGQAVVDGQDGLVPFRLVGDTSSHLHDIQVEGIVFKNSSSSVLLIQQVDRLTLKRVSGYRSADGNFHTFDLMAVNNALIEDCIASARMRVMFDILDCTYVTLRRNYGLLTDGVSTDQVLLGIQIYGSSNCIVENNLFVRSPSSNKDLRGIQIWTHTYTPSASNNTVVGNVVVNPTDKGYFIASADKISQGNSFKQNVAINATVECFEHSSDGALLVENLTCVDSSSASYAYFLRSYYAYYTYVSGFKVGGTIRNSSFMGGITGLWWSSSDPYMGTMTNIYNNYYGIGTLYAGSASAGTGEKTLNPSYPYSTYGNGAYLMVPSALKGKGQNGADIGATILYQYLNGQLTTTPLWPWPLENRIKAELGVSPTWESAGGIWRTLTGVYGSALLAPPSALRITAAF